MKRLDERRSGVLQRAPGGIDRRLPFLSLRFALPFHVILSSGWLMQAASSRHRGIARKRPARVQAAGNAYHRIMSCGYYTAL